MMTTTTLQQKQSLRGSLEDLAAQDHLVPVAGTLVRERGADPKSAPVYQVRGARFYGGRLLVDLRDVHSGADVSRELGALSSALRVGNHVVDEPSGYARTSLGAGEIVRLRTLGGQEQALVELHETMDRRWLPCACLRVIEDPRQSFCRGGFGSARGEAERMRLRVLSRLLQQWNANTGALDRLDVDPLPHQLHLVHHILASGSLNWLIADDVGLGKTIEVGMLLLALMQRERFERVLIVTPAGLTGQWQEELGAKFGLDDFRVYGRDFSIHDPAHWPMYPRVIASIDRLKSPNHLPLIEASGRWDLIIFDEAHRLTRKESGRSFRSSQRFELAAMLREHTDNLLLLTATPHQGANDQFGALIELLRPDWQDQLHELTHHPEVLGQVIYRNRKADVTDEKGEFIFHGQTTHAVALDADEATLAFDAMLQAYVEQGYAQAARKGKQALAIGFVMTIFRKLAASSPTAIRAALERRRARLLDAHAEVTALASEEAHDERFEGEWEEAMADGSTSSSTKPFFDGEMEQLDTLISAARALEADDAKLRALLDQIILPVFTQPGGEEERLLIFTEFRGTQDRLKRALEAEYGEGSVAQIRGGMTLDEKQAVQRAFNTPRAEIEAAGERPLRFLISTEAGGEGLNLHHQCATMVNYDLPWNPMRLVQRIGRLYRYGQQRHVQVFNLHNPHTVDGRVVEMMYARIDAIVSAMSGVSDEFHDRLHVEIFGELVGLLDVEALLDEHRGDMQRSQARVDEALERAKSAHRLQSELLDHVQRFDPGELDGYLRPGPEHLESFIEGMLTLTGSTIVERTHQQRVWRVRLSDDLQRELGMGRAQHMRITTHRRLARHGDIVMMDLKEPLMRALIARAQAPSFGGQNACTRGVTQLAGLLAARQRWQDDQGRIMREEITLVGLDTNLQAVLNPPRALDWLATPALDGPQPRTRPDAHVQALLRAEATLDARLAALSNRGLHPAQHLIFAAAHTSA